MTPILTIAIPTFDRNAMLRDHVALLLPQLTSTVRLTIFDNNSPMPVADTLADLLHQFPAAPVQIVRHRCNIGSSANVMRCLETCETPWLWLLGDDDRPHTDAVSLVFDAIQRYNEYLCINFASKFDNFGREFTTDGLKDFVTHMPSFANMTLISNNVYRADRLARQVRNGYFFAYSLFPHLACVLAELNTGGGKVAFSPRRLVEWGTDSNWSRVMAGLGLGMLLDLPVPDSVRRQLIPLVSGVAGRYSSLIIRLLDQIGVTIDAPTARFAFEQAYQRLYRYDRKILNYGIRWVGKTMMMMPGLSLSVYRAYRKLRGQPRIDKPFDEMGRM